MTSTGTSTGSTAKYAVRDSMTMLRRQFKHTMRYPTVMILTIGMPAVFLLLFVYVFGDTMGNGLGAPAGGGRDVYANYITPAMLVIAVAAAVQGTAISVAMDMTEGIVARFRTMAIARVSVLTGHVLGSLIQAIVGVAVVVGLAILVGFDPNATPIEWLATAGLFVLFTFALIWLTVALGLVSKTVEGASNLPMPLLLLPFLGSGFVPTDSLPAGIKWFAENQPFTPIMETVRGLLTGTEIGNSGWISIAWCVGIALVGYLWAKKLYNRDPSSAGRSYSKVISGA
jgi:ABC-2 type transport system permease protein